MSKPNGDIPGTPPLVEEDVPMTMQIGMVGSDGIVIASDMQAARSGSVRTTYKTSKIYCSHEAGLAYCCAGSDLAVLAGRKTAELIAQGESLTLPECAEKAARDVYRAKYGQFAGTPTQGQFMEVVLLAMVTDSASGLWRVNISGSPYCERIISKDVSGDRVNSAVFFSEQYF